MPAWRRFDPISVVTGTEEVNEKEDVSDVDMMMKHVQDARARVKDGSTL